MEDREIDLKLREVFRRNEPSFEQSQVDMVNQAASSRHVPRDRRRGVLRIVTITVVVLVVAVGLAAGVWQAIAHLGGNNPIVVITDQPTSTGPASVTTTLTNAPQPQPAFTWPHSYPGPVYVPTQAAEEVAQLVVAYLPDLKLTVEKAVEVQDGADYLLDFGTSQRDRWLTCNLFEAGGQPLYPGGDPGGQVVQVEGASEALMIDRPQQSSWQLLARLPDGKTVVNILSSGPRVNGVPAPLLDKEQGLRLAGYLVSLLLSGKITLPEATTTTMVPTIFLPHDVANACGESSMNLLAYVAQGRKTDFAKLLVPAAQVQAEAIWASEQQRFKVSGMSPDHYSAVYAGIAVQWKKGAYVTLDGYFVQTDPPVPAEITAWLSADPAGRAAYGVQLWDKSQRWFRLEGQPDGKWLIVLSGGSGDTANAPGEEPIASQRAAVFAQRVLGLQSKMPELAGLSVLVADEYPYPGRPSLDVDLARSATASPVIVGVQQNVGQDLFAEIPEVASASADERLSVAGLGDEVVMNSDNGTQVLLLLHDGTVVQVQCPNDGPKLPQLLSSDKVKQLAEIVAKDLAPSAFGSK